MTEENACQINGGIKINVDANLKTLYVKNVIFKILVHVVVKMDDI